MSFSLSTCRACDVDLERPRDYEPADLGWPIMLANALFSSTVPGE